MTASDRIRAASHSAVRTIGVALASLLVLPVAASAEPEGAVSKKNGFSLSLEAGWRHTQFDAWGTSSISGLGWDSDHGSEGISAEFAGIKLRGAMPCSTLGGEAYLEAGGLFGDSKNYRLSRFGIDGSTGMATSEVDLDGGVNIGGGFRWSFPVGRSRIGIRPYTGVEWQFQNLTLDIDESAFPGFGHFRTSRDRTLTSFLAGLFFDFIPCDEECGFYLYGGGGYRVPIGNSTTRIHTMAPSGFAADARIEERGGYYTELGAGYRFNFNPTF